MTETEKQPNLEVKETGSVMDLSVVLFPDEQTAEALIGLSHQIKDAVFNLDDGEIRPHITIYQTRYPERNLRKIRGLLKAIVAESRPFSLETGPVYAFGEFVFLGIKPSSALDNLHENIVTRINPLREGGIILVEAEWPGYSQAQQEHLQQYGDALTFDLFQPHITLARMSSPEAAEEAVRKLKKVIPEEGIKFALEKLHLAPYGPNGSCPLPLESYPLRADYSYFTNFALAHRDDLRRLREGLLSIHPREKIRAFENPKQWRVLENQVVLSGVVADVLAEALDFEPQRRERLVRANMARMILKIEEYRIEGEGQKLQEAYDQLRDKTQKLIDKLYSDPELVRLVTFKDFYPFLETEEPTLAAKAILVLHNLIAYDRNLRDVNICDLKRRLAYLGTNRSYSRYYEMTRRAIEDSPNEEFRGKTELECLKKVIPRYTHEIRRQIQDIKPEESLSDYLRRKVEARLLAKGQKQ